jgi:acyl-CoA thioesterase
VTTNDPTPYASDTAVRPDGAGRWRAELTDRWETGNKTPNGGYLLATVLHALAADMPLPHPLVASATFLRPATVGPAQISTEVLRPGRRLATGSATMSQEGRPLVHVVSTFRDGDTVSGRSWEAAPAPELPAPEDCASLLDSMAPDFSIIGRMQYRFERPPGWLGGRPSGDPSATFWIRPEADEQPDLVHLALMVDAAAPVVFELGEFVTATVELTVHLYRAPVPGWLTCRASTRHLVEGFHEEDVELWDRDGRLVAQSRQLSMLS